MTKEEELRDFKRIKPTCVKCITDAMSLQDAIQVFRDTNAYGTMDIAKTVILKALEQTRWVPVSEKLPKKDGCYLVTTTGTNNDIIDIAYYTEGIWHKASRIRAWMPLPEPYEAESEVK